MSDDYHHRYRSTRPDMLCTMHAANGFMPAALFQKAQPPSLTPIDIASHAYRIRHLQRLPQLAASTITVIDVTSCSR